MKAYVLHGVNNLKYEEVNEPNLEEGYVLVKVRAVGICGSDIPRIYQTGAYSHPLIPGHEFAGDVVAVHDSVEREWLGKRVGVFPLIPCKECVSCKKQQFEMCSNYNYLGSRSNGGFAEYVSVPEWNLVEIPANVGYEQAAMLEPMAVAMHAIRRVNIQPQEKVVVCGLGTIGLLVVMILKSMGCSNILTVGNKEIQKMKASDLGINFASFCDLRQNDLRSWVMERTDEQGADVFFECVGKNEVIKDAVMCTGGGGRVMLVGNPASDICLDKEIYWKILRKQLTLQGTWNSSYRHELNDDWNEVIKLLKSGCISPEKLISHRLPFEAIVTGLECMRDKSEEYIKIMGLLQ